MTVVLWRWCEVLGPACDSVPLVACPFTVGGAKRCSAI